MDNKYEYFDKMYEVTGNNSKFGPPSIGICTSEGVALVSMKSRKSKLMITENMDTIYMIDDHIGCVLSGRIADGRVLIDQARVQCQNHRFNYNEKMPVQSCVQTVSAKASEFGNVKDSSLGRPYAVEMLFAGLCNDKPQLWHMDSSGTYMSYGIKSIGNIDETQLETLCTEVNSKQINLYIAISLAKKIIGMDSDVFILQI
ncbi:proteasome subunit alpha type-5 [Zeugodacus cucurbitae]|uniref:Proteasome subunit alpha type-5 n=1 Tax=Zeugodacus cucurbitae TaxID=28588 RepID=A0A0A1WCR6_ZEUCU|nr:proteasome subunit alpha type-5 [Zeugodacus cucurbitae]